MGPKYIAILTFFSILLVCSAIGSLDPAASAANESHAEPAATPVSKMKTVAEVTFTDGEFDGQILTKSETDWKRLLSSDAFYVLRNEGTEKPYTGTLLKNKKSGTYHCAACGLALFSSAAKYESDTGWPSFFQPIYKKNVSEKADRSLSEERVEIECARCGSHIGHVFDDGPKPTGLRYCMNSIALKFKPAK